MTDGNGLAPRWASPPGETIQTVLRERRIAINQFAGEVELSGEEAARLLAGDYAITSELAHRLSSSLGGAAEFWMTRETQYRGDLARVRNDQWAQQFPVKLMSDLGWIAKPTDWHQQIDHMFDFFSVDDVETWESIYEVQLSDARFRSSKTFVVNHAAASVWFRACERAVDIAGAVVEYDKDKFVKMLPSILPLTKRRDPQVFLPELIGRCASVGVAVAVLPAPVGCSASGVARLYDGRPLIQLSARHLADDHFWFTFFHEAGHVVLHDLSEAFIDETALDENGRGTEEEANTFASDLLFSVRCPASEDAKQGRRHIVRLAAENGVSPGIVVGYLQHAGGLPFNRFNYLKRQYIWRGTTLEMAHRR